MSDAATTSEIIGFRTVTFGSMTLVIVLVFLAMLGAVMVDDG